MENNNLPASSSDSFLLYVTEGGKVRIEGGETGTLLLKLRSEK